MENYCFAYQFDFWWLCMTKSEWASWAQAVGTVAAMLASAVVVYWQVHQQHRLHLQELAAERRQSEIEAIEGVTAVIEHAATALKYAHQETKTAPAAERYAAHSYREERFEAMRLAMESFNNVKLGNAMLMLQQLGAVQAFAAAREQLVHALAATASGFEGLRERHRQHLLEHTMAMEMQAVPLRQRAKELRARGNDAERAG